MPVTLSVMNIRSLYACHFSILVLHFVVILIVEFVLNKNIKSLIGIVSSFLRGKHSVILINLLFHADLVASVSKFGIKSKTYNNQNLICS